MITEELRKPNLQITTTLLQKPFNIPAKIPAPPREEKKRVTIGSSNRDTREILPDKAKPTQHARFSIFH